MLLVGAQTGDDDGDPPAPPPSPPPPSPPPPPPPQTTTVSPMEAANLENARRLEAAKATKLAADVGVFSAAGDGDLKALESYLVQGGNPNWVNRDGWTPVQMAAINRKGQYTQCAQKLLAARADVNFKDARGRY